MKIEFMNLKKQYLDHKEEIQEAINSVLDSQQFIQGKHVETFSKNFCNELKVNWGVGCSNGTSAIFVALRCLGIGAGDEVITVANTFFGTVEAIIETGATPVLVDCRPDTYGMDLTDLSRKITNKTKAIIPVHLYGNPVDMETLTQIADAHKINVIEDCAQSHLATLNGKATGSFGDYGTFSFYPGKNLGAYGDAGFIVSKNEELHKKAAMYVDHGRVKKYEHEFPAGNHRMDGMQAAILDVKLKYLEAGTKKRIEIAEKYNSKLRDHDFRTMSVLPNGKCVYHLYIVEVSNRDEVMAHMGQNQIGVGIHYPVPLHKQPALAYLNHRPSDFPVSERLSSRILSLPICPSMDDEQIAYVVKKFLEVAKA